MEEIHKRVEADLEAKKQALQARHDERMAEVGLYVNAKLYLSYLICWICEISRKCLHCVFSLFIYIFLLRVPS